MCMYSRIYVYMYICLYREDKVVCICMPVYMYIYVYTYICKYVCMYTCTY